MSTQDELIASLYAAGSTINEIAKEMNQSSETVRRAMVRAGVERRPRGQPAGKYLPSSGRVTDKDGYIHLRSPGHPYAVNGYVAEHRLAMEQQLGRYLAPSEVVGHRDGVKNDNRIENLELYANNSEHKQVTLKGNKRSLGDIGNPRRRFRRKRAPDQLLNELTRLATTLGRPIRRNDLHPPNPSYRAIARAFGSWQAGVALALAQKPGD